MLFLLIWVEKGKVTAKEIVKNPPRGHFKDCLKIEYWMDADDEAKVGGESGREAQSASPDEAGIELTTLWLAPNVGIVKFIRVSADSKVKKSLELTQYETKSTNSTDK